MIPLAKYMLYTLEIVMYSVYTSIKRTGNYMQCTYYIQEGLPLLRLEFKCLLNHMLWKF